MGKAIDEVSKERLSDRYDPRSEKLDDRKGLKGVGERASSRIMHWACGEVCNHSLNHSREDCFRSGDRGGCGRLGAGWYRCAIVLSEN